MKKIKLIFTTTLLILLAVNVNAQEKFRFQAMFVYNFTRMIAWPQDYQTGEFVIGVFGNSPIFNEFNEIAKSRQVGSQRIVVRQFSSIDEISKCHIIYVATNQSRNISAINAKIKAEKISALIVTDSRNALSDGASVNFVMEGERQRYEMSEVNARSVGLTPGSEMTRLATAVK